MQSKIRSKICGITRVADALAASALGVDAIGLVFYEKSKRFVSVEEAREIARAVGPFVSVVALFVNETAERIEAILHEVPIDVIQFHGDERAVFCEQFARPYLKAVRVGSTEDMLQAASDFPSAKALLFDAYVDGEYGGTGHSFDWQMLPKDLGCHWILSGGLTPDNVTEAVRITGAKAVDISSGVENIAGVKCPQKMAAFLAALQQD